MSTLDDRGGADSIEAAPKAPAAQRLRAPLLFLTVLIIATSGLVYELLAGTLASYVLGDSVTQFSTTIGVYLFSMGIGAYLTRFIHRDVSERFVQVELAAAVVGGGSAPFLFIAFARAESFAVLLYGTIVVIGTLVGIEIPLLMRILREELSFEELVAKVLTVDYIGALFGSLLFALVLVPGLGLNRTSLLFGLLNCGVALLATWTLADLIRPRSRLHLRLASALVASGLLFGFFKADELTTWSEQWLYADPIVYAKQSHYQRIVVTRSQRGTQLFLNGNLQFASSDEHRYHEALVHPAFAAAERRRRVLVLGGGDGLAAREVFRYPEVEELVLIDLDPDVTRLGSSFEPLVALNEASLADPRMQIVNDDAFAWLEERSRARKPGDEVPPSEDAAIAAVEPFDVIVIDFPDPNNFSLGKLYTRHFYRVLRGVMHDETAVVVQASSPLYARKSYWCVVRTMREAGLFVHGYHATVPSFGEWGYVLARRKPFDIPSTLGLTAPLRFLDDATLRSLFVFPADMAELEVETNRLNDQRLVRYYEEEIAGTF